MITLTFPSANATVRSDKRRPAGVRWLRRVHILLALAALTLTVSAQTTNSLQQTNAPDTDPAARNAMVPELLQTNELGFINDMTGNNETEPDGTNATSSLQTNIEVRSWGLIAAQNRTQSYKAESPRRRSRTGRAYDSSSSSSSNATPTEASPALSLDSTGRPNYSNFAVIAQRNIFDPNRIPQAGSRPPRREVQVDYFALVGVMSYEKGTFAFFDGNGSSYRKALKNADTIAGYKITNIDANSVKLAADGKEVELRVGMQMRREEEGPWSVSTRTEALAGSSSSGSGSNFSRPTSASSISSSTSGSAPSGAESDVLKRLMQRREQE